MKKTSHSLLAGTSIGLVLGASLANLNQRTDENAEGSPASALSSTPNTALHDQVTSQEQLPRPTFDETTQLEGIADSPILARFLADATIEEITTLYQLVCNGKTNILDLLWMIEIRGVELDPQEMLASAREVKQWGDYYAHSILKRWAMVDPDEALRASGTMAPPARNIVLSGMKNGDLDRAITAIKESAPNGSEVIAFEKLRWAELAMNEIDKALEGVLAISNPVSQKRNLEAVMEVWVKRDAGAALRWIESHEDLEGKNTLLELAIEELAKTQPSVAGKAIESLEPGDGRGKLERNVVKQWAEQDVDAAISWVTDLPRGQHRDGLLWSITNSLKSEPKRLFGLLQEHDLYIQSDAGFDFQLGNELSTHRSYASAPLVAIGEAALALAKESPEQAFNAMHAIGFPFLSDVATLWVESEPTVAASWAADLPDSDFASSVQSAVVSAWAKSSPELVATFLTQNDLAGNQHLAETLAGNWARLDQEAALDWVEGLDESVRDEVYVSTLKPITMTDPQRALHYVNHISDMEAQNSILTAATQRWREQDPPGVMTWLQSQPPQASIDEIMLSTAEAWVITQPQAASEWINAMDPGPRKDLAASGVVSALLSDQNPGKDIDAAEIWARTITDPDLRQSRLNDISVRR